MIGKVCHQLMLQKHLSNQEEMGHTVLKIHFTFSFQLANFAMIFDYLFRQTESSHIQKNYEEEEIKLMEGIYLRTNCTVCVCVLMNNCYVLAYLVY